MLTCLGQAGQSGGSNSWVTQVKLIIHSQLNILLIKKMGKRNKIVAHKKPLKLGQWRSGIGLVKVKEIYNKLVNVGYCT